MKLIYSNWNRDQERLALKEANDCTVQALASGLGVSYAEAHALLKAGGRKDREGHPFGPFLERMSVPGVSIEKVPHEAAVVTRRQDGSIVIEVQDGPETRHYLRRFGSAWYSYPSMERVNIWTSDWLDTVERYCKEHGGPWPDAHLSK